MHRGAIFIGVVFAVLRLFAAASAQDPDAYRAAEAKRLFDAGKAYSDQGDWESALAAFRDAEAMQKRPSIVLNIGRAMIEVGQYAEAVEKLREITDNAESDNLRKLEAGRLMKRALAKCAQWEVRIAPEAAVGAKMTVDGMTRPETGATRTFYVNAGTHKLVLTAPGFAPHEEALEAAEGAHLMTAVTLGPVVKITPEAVAAAAPVAPAPAPEKDDDGSVFESPWFWVISGAVVVVGAVIAVILLLPSGAEECPNAPKDGCS